MAGGVQVIPTTAADIARSVRSGEVSAREVIESLLADIFERDRGLNCYTQILAERARAQADAVDAKVAQGVDPGPLAGVPFGVKDNYDVVGRVTLAGSIINRGLPPAMQDAVLIRRLTAAGAVLVGTQNMDELAYGFTTENAHYGDTHNPLDTARSAGGSSGGSAAAVAAGLCQFALGTDTNGSIRVPSSFCGIFGVKPTFGRLPRTGTFPFVHDLDHLGLFARNVEDLATVYDTVQGFDPGDQACAPFAPRKVSSHLGEPPPPRIGTLGGWFHDLADAQGRDAVLRVAKALSARETVVLPAAEKARAAAFVLTCSSGGNLHVVKLKSRAHEFDPATRDRLLAGLLLPANAVLQAQRWREVFLEHARRIFEDFDLLLAPATPSSAPLLGQAMIEVGGETLPARANIGLLTQPISFIGLPVVTVPVRNGPMPIGVQLIAPPWREELAFAAAAHLERAGVVSVAEAK